MFGRHDWFTLDDWDFLSARTAGNLGDWFRAHFQHWVMLPMLVYRLVWVFVGLRSYMPYLTVLIVGHLLIAALLRVVMRRAGVNPWLATVAAGGFVVFGAGAENILVAFQITFVGALGFGLVQLVLADHDGPLGRRDQLGLLAGFLGLLCSGVAVVMTVVVGMAVLLRRGWKGRRIAAFHTLPLAVVYAAWSVFAPKGQRATVLQSHSPVSVTKFVLVGIEAAFAGLGQLPGVGIALGLLLAGGLVFTLRTEGRSALRGRRAVPMALLAGALMFLVLTGAARAGEGPLVIAIKHSGTERARDSRYIYTVGAMCLPALALAGDLLVRRGEVARDPGGRAAGRRRARQRPSARQLPPGVPDPEKPARRHLVDAAAALGRPAARLEGAVPVPATPNRGPHAGVARRQLLVGPDTRTPGRAHQPGQPPATGFLPLAFRRVAQHPLRAAAKCTVDGVEQGRVDHARGGRGIDRLHAARATAESRRAVRSAHVHRSCGAASPAHDAARAGRERVPVIHPADPAPRVSPAAASRHLIARKHLRSPAA